MSLPEFQRKPDDIPAFNRATIEVFARRSSRRQ
jgi:hypothetical protein